MKKPPSPTSIYVRQQANLYGSVAGSLCCVAVLTVGMAWPMTVLSVLGRLYTDYDGPQTAALTALMRIPPVVFPLMVVAFAVGYILVAPVGWMVASRDVRRPRKTDECTGKPGI